MRREPDQKELQELESEMGALFDASTREPDAIQVARMTRRAQDAVQPRPQVSWWASLRWMAAGAALSAAALLALAITHPEPPTPAGEAVVAMADVRSADRVVPLAESASGEIEGVGAALFLVEDDELAIGASFDLFYGPMPGDDLAQWDGLYDHLLAEGDGDEFLF